MEDSQENIISEENVEPQVTSNDPNERKLARKLRILRRLEAIRRSNMSEGAIEIVEEKTLFQQQAHNSMEVLRKLMIEADELVSNVRVANDAREVDRREEEGVNKEKIIKKLEEEADDAKDKFDEIAARWMEILKYNDPLAINEEICNQKEKCDALVAQKDSIILMLKDELKQAEIKFSKDQQKQKEDINTLSQRIEKQLVLMRRAYSEQFQLEEEATLIERKILMETNNKKWEDLFKKRRQKEEENCEKKFLQIDEFMEVMKKLGADFQERYREAKIKLENDIENLQLELEKVKTICMLNSEKLDYNYQILKKREDENIIIKSQQKRRLNKLQDIINGLRNKIKNYEDSSNAEIAKLGEQIRKLHADIMKIEEKADHFMETNDTKFHQVWDLNKATADAILEEILKVDRVLYEQQLGLKWDVPDVSLRTKMDLPSYRIAHDMLADADRKSGKGKSGSTLTHSGSDGSKLWEESPTFRTLVRKILKQVSDKTGFFLEDRLKEILEPYTEDDKTLVKLDNVFSALQIKDKGDIRVLVDYFLPYAHCPICTKAAASRESEEEDDAHEKVVQAATSTVSKQSLENVVITDVTDIETAAQQPDEVVTDVLDLVVDVDSNDDLSYYDALAFDMSPSDEEEEELGEELEQMQRAESMDSGGPSAQDSTKDRLFCERNHPLVISSVYILRAVKEFVASIHKPKKGPSTTAQRLINRRETISRLISPEDIEAFWSRYLEVFSPTRLATWDCLYKGMQRYHTILKDRQKINDEVVKLRKENADLKQLLQGYIAKSVKKTPCEGRDEEREARKSDFSF